MKKKILCAVLGMLLFGAGTANLFAVPSELDLYNDLNIYSNAGYYPGVVVQAEQLEQNYPESVFIVEARIAKGQALTILKRYEEAEETFAEVLSSIHFGSEDYAKCWYYLVLHITATTIIQMHFLLFILHAMLNSVKIKLNIILRQFCMQEEFIILWNCTKRQFLFLNM